MTPQKRGTTGGLGVPKGQQEFLTSSYNMGYIIIPHQQLQHGVYYKQEFLTSSYNMGYIYYKYKYLSRAAKH